MSQSLSKLICEKFVSEWERSSSDRINLAPKKVAELLALDVETVHAEMNRLCGVKWLALAGKGRSISDPYTITGVGMHYARPGDERFSHFAPAQPPRQHIINAGDITGSAVSVGDGGAFLHAVSAQDMLNALKNGVDALPDVPPEQRKSLGRAVSDLLAHPFSLQLSSFVLRALQCLRPGGGPTE